MYLHYHDEVVRLVTLRRVVQPKLLVFEQVAVIGQERDAVVHFQRTIPLKLEIPDGIEGVGRSRPSFSVHSGFPRVCPLLTLFGHGHGFHREGIGLAGCPYRRHTIRR